MLERVTGHVTYVMLVRRPLLSAFATFYKFQQAHYNEPAFLLASCRAELQPFLGPMPLLESDWSLFWSSGVMATDACDDAYGVVAAEFAPALVASSGRLQGRHRFRLQSAVQGRKYALGDLDPPSARETVEDLSRECEGCVVDDSKKQSP